MKNKFSAIFIMLFALGIALPAAERMAVAEPVVKSGVTGGESEVVWGILEASADGGYELISRSALKQIMTETGLTNNSDLLNLNSTQKARLGEIKTVKYLLVSSIGKLGARYNMQLMLVDSSTGEIDPEKKVSQSFSSFDELSDHIQDMLNAIGLGKAARKIGRSAILAPVIKVANAPGYLTEDFNSRLEDALLANKIRLQNLQSVAKILKKNNIDNLNEVEPAMYVRIGTLLRVDMLLQATINRFSCVIKTEHIKASNRTVRRAIGNIAGNIRIISAQTGELTGSVPFSLKVDFDTLDSDETEDWSDEDYGRYLIEKCLPDVVKKVIQRLDK